MFVSKLALTTLLFALTYSSFGQISINDKNRLLTGMEIQVIEEILVEAVNLNFPERRALIFAEVGQYLWKVDEKRARQLFESSVNELIRAQNSVKAEEEGTYKHLSFGTAPRWNILEIISGRDAQLAHKLMIKSRPAKLLSILSKFYADENSAAKLPYEELYARNEILKELQLEVSVARQNSKRAVEFIREDLKEGISQETLDLLKELYKQNPKLANQLTEKALRNLINVKINENGSNKLIRYKFQYNYQIVNKFFYALENRTPQKLYPMRVSDKIFRNLVDKISNYWLSKGDFSNVDTPSFKTVEKFFPSRAVQLRQKKLQKMRESRYRQSAAYNQLLKSKPTAEELIRQAEKLPELKDRIHIAAACKLAQSGDFLQAENLLNSTHSDKRYVNNQLNEIYNSLAMQALLENKFPEAEKLITKIPFYDRRIQALIYLAKSVYLYNPPGNKEKALSILSQTEQLLTNPLKSSGEISRFAKIGAGYAFVEPVRGFQMIESIIPELNGQHPENVKFFRQWETYKDTYNLEEAVQTLKKTDVQRTVQLINKFDRPETRALLKLQILQDRRYDLQYQLLHFRTCRN